MFIEMEAPPRSDLAPYLTPRYIQTPCVEILLDRSCMIFEPHRKFSDVFGSFPFLERVLCKIARTGIETDLEL